MVFGLHAYRPIHRFEASAVKATRPIFRREFFFQYVALASSLCVYHGVEADVLEDERFEHLLHVCHPVIIIHILSFRRRLSFLLLDFVLGCTDVGLTPPPLLPLLLFEDAGINPHREGNGFPMHA